MRFLLAIVCVGGLCGFLSLTQASSIKNMQDANEQGKAFAENMKGTVNDTPGELDLNTVPGFSGEQVDERTYYSDGVLIEDRARMYAMSDEHAQFYITGEQVRPTYLIDRANDPLFKREEELTDKAHQLSESYTGCAALPVGIEDKVSVNHDQCEITGWRDLLTQYCTKQLTVSCTNSNAGWIHPFKSDDFEVSSDVDVSSSGPNVFSFERKYTNLFGMFSGCAIEEFAAREYEINFEIDNLDEIVIFMIESLQYKDWVRVKLNGDKVFQGVHDGNDFVPVNINSVRYDEDETDKCRQGDSETTNINLLPFLVNGKNVLTVRFIVSGSGYANLNLFAKKGCMEKNTFTWQCDSGLKTLRASSSGQPANSGSLVSAICVEGAGTKIISGVEVYRACWRWEERYESYSAPQYSRSPKCDQVLAQGCVQDGHYCATQDAAGFCAKEILSFQCESREPLETVDLCGDVLSCPNGECASEYQVVDETGEDFKKAATTLALLKEISESFDLEALSVFTGEPGKCMNGSWGFKNCCKNSGWGIDLGLASCKSEEKELGLAKQAGRTHYVGEFTHGTVLIDKRTYEVYCIYPSKLARIFMVQANVQLGKGYGHVEHLDCQGLSIDELGLVNMESLDLSEFYQDIIAANDEYRLGDPNKVIRSIEDRIRQGG